MNKNNILLIIFIFGSIFLNAQKYKFEWAKKAGFSNITQKNPLFTTDNKNNIYVINNFYDTLEIDGNILISNGGKDFFIAKYNLEGVLIWVKQFGGEKEDIGCSVICDNRNDLIFTGSFTSTVSFGDTSLTSVGLSDIFIAKYDSCGNYIWVHQAGEGNNNTYNSNIGKSVTLDKENNIYIAGNFVDSAYFGDTVIVSADYLGPRQTGFIAKYDSSGNFDWVRSSPYLSNYNQVVIDNENNPYVTGSEVGFTGDNEGYTILYIVKYNETGQKIWEKHAVYCGTYLSCEGRSLAIDQNNHIYVALTNTGLSKLDTLSFSSGNYIIKFDKNGNGIWYKSIAGIFGNNDCSVTCYKNNIYILSSFFDTVSFGDTILIAQSYSSLLIARMDSNGDFLWVKQAGGLKNSSHCGYQITCLNNNDIVISGSINGTAFFDDKTISGLSQGFFAKLTPDTIEGVGCLEDDSFISIFPNPCDDFVTIHINDIKSDEILMQIIDLNGHLFYYGKIHSFGHEITEQLDISEYPKGIYLIKMMSDKYIRTEKLVKY